MKEHLERFPARLPPALKKALADKADALPGTSMNDLVILGVRHVIEGSDLVVTTSGAVDAYEDLVVGAIEGDIAPAKGIARHFVEVGQPNLGALLFVFAARMQPDPKETAKELVRSADLIQRRSRNVARAMLQVALECNPASDLAKSRLGQMRHREGDHVGAAELLEGVKEDDNYAKLAYGWSTLELAGTDPDAVARARDEIVVALRRWALGERSVTKREQWTVHVARLRARSPDLEEAAVGLVAYANDNASWPPIDLSEIMKVPQSAVTSPGSEEPAD